MNLEKYKKFLDGLGTLKGIFFFFTLHGVDVQHGERLSRSGIASSEGSSRVRPSAIDRRLRQIEYPWDIEESLASHGGRREGWCFPWLRFTSLFCLLFGFQAVCLGTKRALGRQLTQPHK